MGIKKIHRIYKKHKNHHFKIELKNLCKNLILINNYKKKLNKD